MRAGERKGGSGRDRKVRFKEEFEANETFREKMHKNAKIFVRILQTQSYFAFFAKIDEAKNAKTKQNGAKKNVLENFDEFSQKFCLFCNCELLREIFALLISRKFLFFAKQIKAKFCEKMR